MTAGSLTERMVSMVEREVNWGGVSSPLVWKQFISKVLYQSNIITIVFHERVAAEHNTVQELEFLTSLVFFFQQPFQNGISVQQEEQTQL